MVLKKSLRLRVSAFWKKTTTDIRDIIDFNHERKRHNPFNLLYLWLKIKTLRLRVSAFWKKTTTDIRDCRDFNHERKRHNPFNLCYLWLKIKSLRLRVSAFWKKTTTDIRDCRDINYERKRKISLICGICVQKKEKLCDLATLRLHTEAQRHRAASTEGATSKRAVRKRR